ncbi:unnamed protein product, partial [Rotaria sp. Silwood2]
MDYDSFDSFYCIANEYLNTVIYSSEFTSNHPIYARIGGFAANYYYETIQVTVPMGGLYTFQCDSTIDSFVSLYYTSFNPSNPALNFFTSFDDSETDNWEFQFTLNFPSAYTIIFVVTTYSPNVIGPFSIVATGPTRATFIWTSIVNPTTTTTPTTTSTTTTTTTPTTTSTTTTTTTPTTTSTTTTTTTPTT